MKQIKFILILLIFIINFIGCNSNKIEGTSDLNSEVILSGKIIDGYIQYATVFLDLDGNDRLDNGEPNAQSDALGNFKIRIKKEYIDDKYRLVAYKGFDIQINNDFKSILKANPKDNQNNIINLTPISTLVSQYQIYKNVDLETAKQKVSTFIDVNTTNMEKDPIAEFETNPDIYKQNLKLQKIVESSTQYIFNDITTTRSVGIFNSIAQTIDEGKTLETIDKIKVVALDNYNWKTVDIGLIVKEISKTVDTNITSVDTSASSEYNNLNNIISNPDNLINTIPQPLFKEFTIDEDGIYKGYLTARDDDNDTLTYSIVTYPRHGALILDKEGNFTYNAISNYNGTDSFIYKVFDGHEYSIQQQVNITIVALNDTPQFEDSPNIYTIKENQIYVCQLQAKDSDNTNLTYKIESQFGDGNKFIINPDNGIVMFKDKPDYDDPNQKKEYTLEAIVTDGQASSNKVITVKIENVPDVVPVLANSTLNAPENLSPGSLIEGNITIITQGDTNITSITLSGDGSENFVAENNGSIRLSQIAKIDYETNTTYHLQAIAQNQSITDDGIKYSNKVDITINILDTPDIKPILYDFNKTIDENTENNTTIGFIRVKQEGDSPITKRFLSGDGSSAFSIGLDGTLKVADQSKLDYETTPKFEFSAYAVNGAGESNASKVIIYLHDIPDVAPILNEASFNIDENATANTFVGQISLEKEGDRKIVRYELNDTSIFDINSTGAIKLLQSNTLDYEKQAKYYLEVNATTEGNITSPNAKIIIEINNIEEKNLYLSSVVYNDFNNNNVADDEVYIFFSIEPDSSTLNQAVDDYEVIGTGDFGSSMPNTNFNTTPFFGYYYTNLTTAFIPNSTKLQIKKFAITDTYNQTPSDYNQTIVLPFIPILQTNQTDCYDRDNVSNTWDCSDTSRAIGDAVTKEGIDINFTKSSTNTIVIDNINGNLWSNEENQTFNYADALTHCENLNIDGNTSWDLPTTQELAVIVDKNSSNSNIAYFSEFNNTSSANYWTKDNRKDETSKYWVFNFTDGTTSGITDTDSANTICIKRRLNQTHKYLRDDNSSIVLDTTTNLMWEDTQDSANSNNTKDWVGAFDYCDQLNIGGFSDWRVPNINELYSIVNVQAQTSTDPSIYPTFKNTAQFVYWSSSVLVSDDTKRWVVDFNYGDIKQRDRSDTDTYIRCVRNLQ